MEINTPGPEKKIFIKGFYHIWAWWPSLSCHQNFIFLYLKAFIQTLVQIGKVVSEKIQFEFLYVHDLGPRASNYLDTHISSFFN